MSDLDDAIAALQQTLAKADGRAGRDGDGDGKLNEHAKAAAIGVAVGAASAPLAAKFGSAVALKVTAGRRDKVAERKWWDGSNLNDKKEAVAARGHPDFRVGGRVESYDLDALRPGWRDRSFAAGMASREKYTRLAERAAARGGARIGGLAAPAIGALAAGVTSYAMSKTDGLDSAIAELEQTLAKAWDDRALRAATSRVADPTPAQATAGNYRKGHLKVHDLDVTIENPAGSERRGVGPDGKPWTSRLPAHYGYVRRTLGADGDAVDVYLGPAKSASHVYVVDQIDPATGKFDEHKCVLGCHTELEARQLYHAGFSDGSGPQRVGAMIAMPIQQFKSWLRFGDTTAPVAFREGVGKMGGLQKAVAALEATLAKADGRAGRDGDGDGKLHEKRRGARSIANQARIPLSHARMGGARLDEVNRLRFSPDADAGGAFGPRGVRVFAVPAGKRGGDKATAAKKSNTITIPRSIHANHGPSGTYRLDSKFNTALRAGALRHELGHSIDAKLGRNGKMLSDHPDFKRLFNRDIINAVKNLKSHVPSEEEGVHSWLSEVSDNASKNKPHKNPASVAMNMGYWSTDPQEAFAEGYRRLVSGSGGSPGSGKDVNFLLDTKGGSLTTTRVRQLLSRSGMRVLKLDESDQMRCMTSALEETLAKAEIKSARRTVMVERALAKSAKGTDGDHDGVLSEGHNGNRQRGSAPVPPKTGILEREGGNLGEAVGFAAGGALAAAALSEHRKKGGLKAAPAAGIGRKLSPGGIQTRIKALARGGVKGAVAGVARGVGGSVAKLVVGGVSGLAVGAGAMAVGAAADNALGNAKTRPRREGDYEAIGSMAGSLVGGIAGGAAAGLAAIPSGPAAIAAAIAGEAGGAYGGGKAGGALGRLLDRMK